MVQWLTVHRTTADATRLLAALARMRVTLGRFPGIGEAVVERANLSVRVLGLGRLPYLVWYGFEPDMRSGPVWLLALMHEKQDRARFDPALFDL